MIPTWTRGQSGFTKEQLARPVIARVSEMPAMYVVDEHQHPWGQLAYASAGIMKVNVPGASYIIPPQKALWIPPFTPHVISTRYGLSFRSLYIDNDWSSGLPETSCSINVEPLLRELILQVTTWGDNYSLARQNTRLLKVLLDQIVAANHEPLYLKMPTDKRLLQITTALSREPALKMTLQQWSEQIGATSRTLNRLFTKETQMGYVEWRQRLRILHSLERIELGDPIETIASDIGYESSSAFITMFKKHLGCSPRQYFKNGKNNSSMPLDSKFEMANSIESSV